MSIFKRPEYWAWLFKGAARAEFERLPADQQDVAVKAALRLRAAAERAEVVRLHQGWENEPGLNARPAWLGSFGRRDERRQMMRADFVVEVGGDFTVLKDRTGEYLAR